ncbi:MAG: HDOD domain-containing protein [Opitutus sp.]
MALHLPFFKPTPESLVRRLEDLPPAPKVLHSLQRVLQSEGTSMDDIAEIIRLEPGLSARVVKMSKSVQFSRGAQIDTIFDAIQRVGIKGVHELVTFAVASQLVGRPLLSYQLKAQEVWYRAVACAIAASSLAENSHFDRSDAYTAGLMHALGLMVIDRYAARDSKQRILRSSGYPVDFSPAEHEWLGFTHADAGAALLELWGFSESVTCAVRFQLNPEMAPPEHRQLCMILATARWARSVFCVPEESIPDLPPARWMEEAGVEISDFSWWLSQVRIRYRIACDELRLG